MSAMKHSTTVRPPGATPGDTSTATTDTAERAPGTRHFQSLILPGLAKGPILPVWLHKHFRRTNTPTSPQRP
jgi:hypothetical protein